MAKRRHQKDARRASNRSEGVQTTLAFASVDETPNSNVSYPYGIIRTVRHYLGFIGLLKYLRGLKRKDGPRLDLIVVALCSYALYTANSMDACSRWLEDPKVKTVIGFRKDENVSQRTIVRAVQKLGEYKNDILTRLYEGVISRFEIDDYDIIMDGSAVILNGPKSAMAAYGHPRDGRAGDLQVEFMVAVLSQIGVPVYIKSYKGNVSDEKQYADAMPEIRALVGHMDLNKLDAYKSNIGLAEIAALTKVATTIIADNGDASNNNALRAKKLGFERITRKKLNLSDDEHILNHYDDFEVIPEENVMCCKHVFESSGRTTYLYCSPELLQRSVKSATSNIRRGAAVYEDFKKNGIRKSKIVKVKKIPYIDVTFDIVMNEPDLPFSERQINRLGREKAGLRAGFFKLESSVEMTPLEALRTYRHRAIVELTISSLKRVSGIKPLRVWSEKSIDGSMVLALLAEAAMSMARYCLGKRYRPVDRRSGKRNEAHVPSTATISRELGHLTLTRFKAANGPWDSNLSNWTPLCEAVFEDIHQHEDPKWGNKKVPLST